MDVRDFLARRRTIATRAGDVAYTEFGEGPAAVFVHGVLVNGLLWRNVIEQVADQRRCIAIDLPGHGGTPLPADGTTRFASMVAAVEALADALGLDTFDLVGNDTGGLVCQLFAARNPGRLRSLTLTNCDAHDQVPPEAFKPALELARQGLFAPFLRSLLDDLDAARGPGGFGIGYQHPERLSAELIRAYLEPVVGTEEAGRRFEEALGTVDPDVLVGVEARLRELPAPVLLVWGTADHFFPLADAETLRGIFPDVRGLVEVPGGMLFFPDERAGELAPHLRAFWNETAPQAQPA